MQVLDQKQKKYHIIVADINMMQSDIIRRQS